MDSHTKPYTCSDTECPRSKRGFSRKDNLNVHLQKHRKAKRLQYRDRERSVGPRGKRTSGNLGDMLLGGITAERMGRRVKNMSRREKRVLLALVVALFDDEEEEEIDDQDDEEEEEDDEE
jgi:hypothetical protein